MSIGEFITTNWESISTIIILILGIVKVSKWGTDKADALNLVAGVLEDTKNTAAKVDIKNVAAVADVSRGVKDAIQTAALTADPVKPNPVQWKLLLREVLRGIIRVQTIT